jgi:L-lactate dehydrogenase
MNTEKSKIAVIGAGFVGAATAYTIALSQLVNEIVMIDVMREKAIGEAMDISHGLSHIGQMRIHAGDYSDCADCDVIIVTAGLNRKPGETRLDLANKNVPIARSITENIMKYYTRGVILVVANPVDILTYMIQKWSGLPNGRVMGTGTALDSARFRYTLSARLHVDIQNVHAYIIGEHGDSQLPIWSASSIACQSLDEYCANAGIPMGPDEKAAIMDEVRTAGAEVIKNKGATYYAIASVVTSVCETLIKNKNTIRTVASVVDGPYGIHDLTLSLPCIVNKDGIRSILNLRLSADEEANLAGCAGKMKAFLNSVNING